MCWEEGSTVGREDKNAGCYQWMQWGEGDDFEEIISFSSRDCLVILIFQLMKDKVILFHFYDAQHGSF